MNGNTGVKLFFVINTLSGRNDYVWKDIINNFFNGKGYNLDFFLFDEKQTTKKLEEKIRIFNPDKVIAVGGDGTVNMVAKIIAGSGAALGILPSGSSNGMAKELDIPLVPEEALAIIENGIESNCDAISINNRYICLHLSDVGLNAQLIKYFEEANFRGKWGYARVILKTLWHSQKIEMVIESKNKLIISNAFMVVLANASKYGTGATINPLGRMDDGLFEVVIVRKISLRELLTMLFIRRKFDPKKIQIFHAVSVKITTKRKVHFQIDGEYKGKVNSVEAFILPDYIKIILPANLNHVD
jgi:YegS/Rv2252/BmrU family lipid kinase